MYFLGLSRFFEACCPPFLLLRTFRTGYPGFKSLHCTRAFSACSCDKGEGWGNESIVPFFVLLFNNAPPPPTGSTSRVPCAGCALVTGGESLQRTPSCQHPPYRCCGDGPSQHAQQKPQPNGFACAGTRAHGAAVNVEWVGGIWGEGEAGGMGRGGSSRCRLVTLSLAVPLVARRRGVLPGRAVCVWQSGMGDEHMCVSERACLLSCIPAVTPLGAGCGGGSVGRVLLQRRGGLCGRVWESVRVCVSRHCRGIPRRARSRHAASRQRR